MASNFDPSESDSISDINITPFVDVVLVLLVIFMVTAPIMVKETMNIKLPKGKSTERSAAKTFAVAISKNGQVLLEGEIIEMTLLYDKAVKLKKEFPEIQLLISADKKAMHGDIIAVLDQVKLAGITNFAFQVEKIIED
jgi:biopolymer transport protein ExbD